LMTCSPSCNVKPEPLEPPEYIGGVPPKALPLLGCTLGTPGTRQNGNTVEKAETGRLQTGGKTGKSLTRPYLLGVSEVSRVQASIGRACAETHGGIDGVSQVTARGELPILAAEPIERGLWLSDNPDERRLCTQCLNLRGAVCIVAKPGGLVSAIRGYQPALVDILQTLRGFMHRTPVTPLKARAGNAGRYRFREESNDGS
jgi:hypothetical protein